MKSFVVMTYYQLMHATAMTLELGEKTDLYFVVNYLKVSDEMLERIRETGIFNSVVGLDNEENMGAYKAALQKTEGLSEEEIDKIGDRIFIEYLEPCYKEKFANADFEDEIFVYNDFQRPFFYIAKYFKNIVGVEDGYQSLSQQLKVHKFKGEYERVIPFLGKYYPEPLYRNEKIKKIISSCDFDDLPDYYRKKLEIIDFNDLVNKNRDAFISAQLKIFELENIKIEDGSTLLLGTPLSRSLYCNAAEDYLFYRKVIREEKKNGKKIYFKPHPADTLVDRELYEDNQVVVLPRKFPIELLEYQGVKFKKAISFGSTALVDAISESCVYLYTGNNEPEDIKRYIMQYIEGEKIRLDLFIRITRPSVEKYINVYSFLYNRKSNKLFDIKTHFYAEEKNIEEYEKYFDSKNLNKSKKIYVEKQRKNGNVAYDYEIRRLRPSKDMPLRPNIVGVKCDPFDEIEVYNEIIREVDYEYFILLDDYNMGFHVIKNLISSLSKHIRLCYTYIDYTYADNSTGGKRIFLGSGRIGDFFSGQIENRVWNKKIDSHIPTKSKDRVSSSISKALQSKSDSVQYRAILMLHKESNRFTRIENGKKHYTDLLEDLLEQNQNKEDLCGQIALLMREYYNWSSVVSPGDSDGLLTEFLESSVLSDDIKAETEKIFMEQILKEQRVEYNRGIYSKLDDFNYCKKEIKILTHGRMYVNYFFIRKLFGVAKNKKNRLIK